MPACKGQEAMRDGIPGTFAAVFSMASTASMTMNDTALSEAAIGSIGSRAQNVTFSILPSVPEDKVVHFAVVFPGANMPSVKVVLPIVNCQSLSSLCQCSVFSKRRGDVKRCRAPPT